MTRRFGNYKLFPALGITLLLFIVWLAVSLFKKRQLQRKLCTKDYCNVENDGRFGFRIWKTILQHKRNGTINEYQCARYKHLANPKVGTFQFKIFGVNMTSTKDPENIKAILTTQFKDFGMGNRRQYLFPLLGNGIFNVDGDSWKHSRALLRPQFTRQNVERVTMLEPHIQYLAKRIQEYEGHPFDLQDLIYRFTVDSATELLFGESANSLLTSEESAQSTVRPDNLKFAQAFNLVQCELGERMMLQQFSIFPTSRKFKECLNIVNLFANFYINKTLLLDQKEIELKLEEPYIFLYHLIQETRDPAVLRDELLNILLAGRDTTAALISFTIYELCRNPEMWELLRLEVLNMFGHEILDISFETMKQCQFLKAILNETLRMYPSVPMNSRKVRRNTTLPRGGGKDGQSSVLLTKGQIVAYCVYAMQRDPEIYGDDSHLFDPLRWLNKDRRTDLLGWKYLPFNGGPRICLGQQFALTEASYVLVRMAQIFKSLKSARPDARYPPKISNHMTISLMEGLEVCLR